MDRWEEEDKWKERTLIMQEEIVRWKQREFRLRALALCVLLFWFWWEVLHVAF